jgi:hypothetical protein
MLLLQKKSMEAEYSSVFEGLIEAARVNYDILGDTKDLLYEPLAIEIASFSEKLFSVFSVEMSKNKAELGHSFYLFTRWFERFLEIVDSLIEHSESQARVSIVLGKLKQVKAGLSAKFKRLG